MKLLMEFENGVKIEYAPVEPGVIEVAVPMSKSIVARALILDYIYGKGVREDGSFCKDNCELRRALFELSLMVPNPMDMMGEGVEQQVIGDFNLGSGGTSLRFFIALVASIPGLNSRIDCAEQLKARPVSPLVEGLREFGARIEYLEEEGRLPIYIEGCRIDGGEVYRPVGGSSQFASALAMASLLWQYGLDIKEEGMVSLPYYIMTRKMMEWYARNGNNPAVGGYQIEGDWSAAGFFYEAVLLNPDFNICIRNLDAPADSVQGDAPATSEIFATLGVETVACPEGGVLLRSNRGRIAELATSGEIMHFDMERAPDLVPALSVGMTLAGIRYRLTGVKNLRIKECDRLHAIASALGELGYAIEVEEDAISWTGATIPAEEGSTLQTFDDHRMVMALSMVALTRGEVTLEEVDSVAKSFPCYFSEAAKLGLTQQN